jgi:hypothetical protein
MKQNRIDGLYWWQLLPAIPQGKDTQSYRRLERVWRDHTRFKNPPDGDNRLHEFYENHYETHWTCTLFENFSLFKPEEWVKPFLAAAGLPEVEDRIQRCGWSYEWETNFDRNGEHQSRQCDVVVSFETSKGQKGAVIVEAKGQGKKPGKKDFDIDYYLADPHFDPYRENLSLVYLVDSKVREFVETKKPEQTGLITWQELGALQIRLAKQLAVEPRIKHFIAGAIQYHFLRHKITPSELCAEYLSQERSLREIHDQEDEEKQASAERIIPLWELGN